MEISQSRLKQVVIETFPSSRFIISLYVFGAFVSLAMAFSPAVTAGITTNCLTVSWALALGALAMSVATEASLETDEDLDS